MQPLLLHVGDEVVVETLEADGMMLEDGGDVIGGFVDARIAEDEERPGGRTIDEARLRFEDGDAGAFAADERLRKIEAMFRKQLRQVVAGYAPRDIGETLPN